MFTTVGWKLLLNWSLQTQIAVF